MHLAERLIVDAAYALDASPSYKRFKHRIRRLLNDPSYPPKHRFDLLIVSLILFSVAVLVRNVHYEVDPRILFFNNYIVSLIFLIEYLLRLWVAVDRHRILIERYEQDLFVRRPFSLREARAAIGAAEWRFVRSPQAVIDLLAVVPFFHELRIMRVFILFRVFKLFRYTRRIQNLVSILAVKKFELLTLMVFAFTVIAVATILIYVIEARNPHAQIDSLYHAFYWTIVTLSTVGFGDTVPVSDEGRFVAIVVIVLSVSVLAFATSIIVSAFTQKLDEIKENDNIEKSIRLHNLHILCGWSTTAQTLAQKLASKGKHFLILLNDAAQADALQKEGYLAFALDPTRLESYRRLEIDFKTNVAGVLCLYEDDVRNIYVALTLRSIDKEVRIISLLENETNRLKMQRAGVNDIVHPQHLVGLIAREFGGSPVAFEVIHALRSEHHGARVEELVVDEFIAAAFSTLEAMEYERFHLLLLGIKKEGSGFVFNPRDATPPEPGDRLIFVGEAAMLVEFDRFIHGRRHS